MGGKQNKKVLSSDIKKRTQGFKRGSEEFVVQSPSWKDSGEKNPRKGNACQMLGILSRERKKHRYLPGEKKGTTGCGSGGGRNSLSTECSGLIDKTQTNDQEGDLASCLEVKRGFQETFPCSGYCCGEGGGK